MEFYRSPNSKDILACGLNWVVSDPFESIHLQVSRYILDGARNFVKFANGVDINYGLTADINREQYAGCRFISLAKLAATNPLFKGATVLLFLVNSVSADHSGVAIGLLNGNVVLDRQIERDSAESVFGEFSALCEKSGRVFRFFGDFPGLTEQFDEAYFFDALIKDQGSLKKALITPLKNNRTALIVVIIVLSLIALSLVNYGWDWYVQKQKQLIEEVRAASQSPEAQYSAQINIFLWAKQHTAGPTSKEVKKQLEVIPYQFHGWDLKEIKCELPECTFKWASADGSYGDFRNNAPKEWLNISPMVGASIIGDLKTITHQFKLELHPETFMPRTQWPTKEDFAWSIGEAWQKLSPLGWRGDLKPAELRQTPVGIPSAAIKNHPQAIWGVPWSVINQPWWLFDALDLLGKNVVLQKVDISIDKSTKAVSFNASGIAYVKNQ